MEKKRSLKNEHLMKILIYFQKDKLNKPQYEGARVAKNLINACQRQNIETTEDPNTEYDIAHFVGAHAYKFIHNAKLRKIPIVISALVAENDPLGKMLVIRQGKWKLKKHNYFKALQKATLIIVPTESGRIILKHLGIDTPIEILSEGMINERFLNLKEIDKKIFRQYFKFDGKKPLIISHGAYQRNGGIIDFIELAKLNPDKEFYFFGIKPPLISWRRLRGIFLNISNNLHLQGLLEEDLYRSALSNAHVLVLTGTTPMGTVSIIDAMASKTQIIARQGTGFPELLINKKSAYICESLQDIDKKLNQLINGKIDSTIDQAYQIAQKFDIVEVAKKLTTIYATIINLEKKKAKIKRGTSNA
jgi:glycosyltransferase involved in cell wall biosynthesis